MGQEDKSRYSGFCAKVHVPIYSQPWWMNAVCGPKNWDVWLYEQGGDVAAAMPYYLEKREHGLYITKAPLTQNNGIIFDHARDAKPIARAKAEERIVEAACEHVATLGLAVYEQQYSYTFTNWLPFFWNGYTAIPRYTYVVEDTSDEEAMWAAMDPNARQKIRKGAKRAELDASIGYREFYREHEKVFAKQGLSCPFSEEMWEKLYLSAEERECCQLLCERTADGSVASLLFLVWDDVSMYSILGGSMPEYMNLETYHTLIWEGMKLAGSKGLKYDFEGSVIKRISKSFREFGGKPKLYFRIRKIFSPEVIRMEADRQIEKLVEER